MAPKKKRSNHDKSLEEPDSPNDSVSQTLIEIAQCMRKINVSLEENRNCILGLSSKIDSTNLGVNIHDQHLTESEPGKQQRDLFTDIPGPREKLPDRTYISAWKDLGGNNIHFSPGGSLHPISFIKKLETAFNDANVPGQKRVNFSVNALRGSAQIWGTMKEETFLNFDVFKQMFLNRYWGVEQERELFNRIKFGQYENGSRADYFLKIVSEARFLTQIYFDDTDIIKMAIQHFPSDIRRNLLLINFNSIDAVEGYLRDIDLNLGAESDQSKARNNEKNNWRDRNRNGNARDSNPNSNAVFDISDELLEESLGEIKNLPILPTISIKFDDIKSNALIDSGSQISCISQSFFDTLTHTQCRSSPILKLPAKCSTIMGALGEKTQKVREQVFLKFGVNDTFEFEYPYVIVPKLTRDMILGCDWMQDHQISIDFENKKIMGIFGGNHLTFNLSGNRGSRSNICVNEILMNKDEIVPVLEETDNKGGYSKEEILEVASRAQRFNEIEKQQLGAMLLKFKNVFSDIPGKTHLYEHEIQLHDYTPFYIKSYPIPKRYKDEVKLQINEMLDGGIIEQAPTEYVSPLVVVTKKDGSARVCIDARFINKKMVKNHIVPPNPGEILLNFGSNEVFSVIDLTASYWQIPIVKSHQKYAGFSHEGKTYVFKVLPFGFATSVGSFIIGLSKILGPEVEKFAIPYVDDIFVHSENSELHLEHLEFIFEKFRQANITIKLKKSNFACCKIKFLGHIITPEGVEMDPTRIEAITDFPEPRNLKELRSFLGLVNYDRRFCQSFSELTVPLTNKLKKGIAWVWVSEDRRAFDNIKEAFLKVTLLQHPRPDLRFYVQADASQYAIGAILFQKDPASGNRLVIAYTSRSLNNAEVRYCITEKEALAVIHALRQWRVFLLGRPVTVVTDHKALIFIQNCRLLNARLTRWILFLQEYDLELEYCKGSENIIADVLSRFPYDEGNVKRMDQVETEQIAINVLVLSLVTNIKEEFKAIVDKQDEDEFCVKLKGGLMQGKSRRDKWYVLHGGKIFRRGTVANPGLKLVVPKVMVAMLVYQEHSDNGHFGSKKCWLWLRRYYYFKKMRFYIRKIISGCEICQKTKISPRCHGESQSVLVEGPNCLVCLDFMGPLPVSRGGVTQLLVLVDAFTKYVSLYALRRATAKSVLRVLTNQYFDSVGKPRSILSDNGTQFQSKVWLNTLADLNIRAVHTSVYYPQGNMTERVNREVGRMLRMFCHAQHTKWACYLKDVQNFLNSAIHESTGYAPIELHFGKTREFPFKTCIRFPDSFSLGDQVLMLAQQNLKSAARKRQLNVKDRVIDTFTPGDMVLVRSHHLSSAENREIKKFFLLYEGPFVVRSVRGPNSYEIYDEGSDRSLGIHNIYNLKRYIPMTEQL